MAPAKYPHVTAANKYARDIVSGRIPACVQVQQACQRHLDDLQSSKKANYPYKFDKAKGERICQFAELMVHTKGKWQGNLIILEPWQKFILAVPFGWVRKTDGMRRFREIYDEIPRKAGKSVIGAVIGLYMLVCDDEPGAETYCAATSEAQAYEVFRPAWMMIYLNPRFKERFGIELGGTVKKPGNIYVMASGSRFETVIGKPGDGASPHCWLQDEYHESKTSDSFDTGKTGMGARPQPMLAVITTAGTNTSYPCFDKRKQVEKILSGEMINDEIFGIIYTIDEDDDWADFKNWIKANPNIGVSVFEDFLKSQLKAAAQDPRKQNILKCKHLNIWSNAGVSAFNMVNWNKCGDLLPADIVDFEGESLFNGLDLASKNDICSSMRLFKRGEEYYLFSRHYLPEIKTHGEEYSHYAGWAHDGYITIHPGARINLNDVEADIKKDAELFDLSGEENGGGEVCADPWNAQQMTTNLLSQGIEVVDIAQTFAILSEPFKELQVLIDEGKFHHDNNPVTTWMFGNTVAKMDNHDNIKPIKEGDENKIDGPVATITAMARAMYQEIEEEGGNDGSLLLI